ncbi:MAG: LuxR C-terminal-related transcriptional regulator [Afipia sp.]
MNIAIPRIVLADDHPLMLAALKAALSEVLPQAEIIICSSVEGALAAIEKCAGEIDLLLLDLDMPGSRGFTGLFTILRKFPVLPIAIISATQTPQIVHRALQYGAAGYICKSMSLPTMQEAVLSMLEGRRFIPPGLEQNSDLVQEIELGRRFSSLSAQQLKILAMIVDGKLNKQIGAELNVAEQTVKIHVSTILRKLNVQSRTQAAVLAERLFPSSSPDRIHDFSRRT